MSEADAAYLRLGDLVWGRFRALGVREAQAATLRWFRAPEQGWLGRGTKVNLTRLLLDATDAALDQRNQPPVEAACGPYLANAKQLARVLDAPIAVRKALVLLTADGLDTDEVASLLGMTGTAVTFAMNDVDDELAELSDPLPDGSLEDDHLSTIQLHGFALEVLDPLQMQQYEQHLASCSLCFHRFDAWSKNKEAFDALPKPVPPKPPSRALPFLVLGFVLLAATGAFVTAVALALTTAEQQVEAERWKGDPATVEVRTAAGPVADGVVAPGDLLQIWLDPGLAGHAGFASGAKGQLHEVLAVRRMERGGGLQLAPVEVPVGEMPPTVWVLVSDRPLSEMGVREAIEKGRDDIAVTQIDLVFASDATD
ncbi:MAG: hypothetical protein H6737_12980 [Alphaproteobacteria bacterium]|nr:hypothetical protein [Alphaproteobacteria bacterium]